MYLILTYITLYKLVKYSAYNALANFKKLPDNMKTKCKSSSSLAKGFAHVIVSETRWLVKMAIVMLV